MTAAAEPGNAPEIVRRVEHVMGLPISLAPRGRHTSDTAANDAWHALLAELRRIDAVFSRYRPDTVISRLGRGELTEAQCPAEVHEVLALAATAERASHGAFAVRRPNADGDEVLDTDGVVKGWAADRGAEALRAPPLGRAAPSSWATVSNSMIFCIARSGCDDRVRRRARTRNPQRVLLWPGDSATVSAATARR
jgi:ApbE family